MSDEKTISPEELPELPKRTSVKKKVKKVQRPVYQKPVERLWKNIIPVFFCPEPDCDFQDNDRGNVIVHMLGHYPESERDAILDELVKE